VVDDQWVVRAPRQLVRGLDFGHRPPKVGQRGQVEVSWGTDCQDNYSADGVNWERPRFDHCPFKLRNPSAPDGPPLEYPVNNIVFNLTESADGMDSPTVVKDLRDPDPARRYKMSYWHRLGTGTGIYHAHSPDGIHWTHIPRIVANTGDRNTFHWDPFRNKWMTVSRPAASFYEFERFGEFNNNFVRAQVNMEPRDRLPQE
jgi:hypothetical protein